MQQNLISEIDAFIAETGLSDHRVGFLLAKNGKLIERLRMGRRIWPETEATIRKNLDTERRKRADTSKADAA